MGMSWPTALGDAVEVSIGAARVTTRAKTDNVFRFRHLIVKTTDSRRHFVGYRASSHH